MLPGGWRPPLRVDPAFDLGQAKIDRSFNQHLEHSVAAFECHPLQNRRAMLFNQSNNQAIHDELFAVRTPVKSSTVPS